MKQKIIKEGNAFFEIDDECIKRKERDMEKEKEVKKSYYNDKKNHTP